MSARRAPPGSETSHHHPRDGAATFVERFVLPPTGRAVVLAPSAGFGDVSQDPANLCGQPAQIAVVLYHIIGS